MVGLGPSPERLQSGLLFGVDFEEVVEPGQIQKGLNSLVDMDQLQLAANFSHDGIAAGQFAEAIAVDEIHARKIDQKLLAAIAGMDVDQVAQLGAAIAQRESAHDIHDDDSIELSGCHLKGHGCRRLFFAESYAGLNFLSTLADSTSSNANISRPVAKSGILCADAYAPKPSH
jgi:hypothetical protein